MRRNAGSGEGRAWRKFNRDLKSKPWAKQAAH